MGETINVSAPAILLVQNTGDADVEFMPYKENFKISIASGSHILFPVTTSGQVLYYFNQQYGDLTIKVFDAKTEKQMDNFIPVYPTNTVGDEYVITLSNVSNKDIKFIPYRENFDYVLAAGDRISIAVNNIGQVFYYMAQQVDGLEIDIPTQSIGQTM